MAELLVIPPTGQKAYDKVMGLQMDMIVQLERLALVTQDAEGWNRVETPAKLVSSGAAFCALWAC